MSEPVLIGPSPDLHLGIHRALIDAPPPGYVYRPRLATHRFLFPAGAEKNPFHAAHWGELCDFGPGEELVHTHLWPVFGRRAWVADMDDFGHPIFLGRQGSNLDAHEAFNGEWSDAYVEVLAPRVVAMLRAYTHPSCKGVLMMTRHALAVAERWIDRIGMGALGRRFLAKCSVVYPAQRACSAAALASKWRPGPLRVLFCGHDFLSKRGDFALALMARLAPTRSDVEFHYAGRIPAEVRAQIEGSCPPNLFLHHEPDRAACLELFGRCHLLFHPSLDESFGFVFAEAAAWGAAVLCASGHGMDHVGELFAGGGAALVDRDQIGPDAEDAAFEAALVELLGDRERLRTMGHALYAEAVDGVFSVRRRSRQLAEVYAAALASPAPEGIDADAVWGPFSGEAWSIRSDALQAMGAEYRRGRGLHGSRLFV